MSARGGLNLAYNHKDFLSRLGRDHLMKKKYEAPTAETVKFEYKDQVVAASGGSGCHTFENEGRYHCDDEEHTSPTRNS